MIRKLTCLAWLLIATHAHSQLKITITPDMLINLSAQGDATLLINEQRQCGDPKNEPNDYIPKGNFNGGYNALYYPVQVVIDLQVPHKLSDIYLFDAHDHDSIHLYTGNPVKWQHVASHYLGSYNRWQSTATTATTRYVMLEFPTHKANVAEIVLYGTAQEKMPPKPGPTPHPTPLFENFMGINGVHNQPITKLLCVGTLREYHSWPWDEGDQKESYTDEPTPQMGFNPSWAGGTPPWNFDDTYRAFKLARLDVTPCLHKSALYAIGKNADEEWKPVSENEDASHPASYKEHARYMYQFAARYGSQKVPEHMLTVEKRNTKKSGLGLVSYLENWNEPDKWWRGREGYFTPFELAAMCSADYDGHEGSLGPGHGIKNADPNMKMAMGGLANLSVEYIKGMKLWSDHFRTSGFPADVLNVHHYSNVSSGQNAQLVEAISPEADSLKYKLRQLVDYRNRYLPGKEIWLSEFGYDTNPKSPQGVKAIGSTDELHVQAIWLVRAFLEIAAAGLDRAHVFAFGDTNAKNPTQFSSSGVTNEKWYGNQPKPAWYYLYCLKKILTGYRFASEVPASRKDVHVYKFENPADASCIYAVWCPTATGQIVSNYTLPIDATQAEVMELSDSSTTPNKRLLTAQDKPLIINVSETPVFIKVR